MNYIEWKDLQTWREYVEIHENIDLAPYIFRGQTNGFKIDGKFGEWRLDSSFNRTYPTNNSFSFSYFLTQQLETEIFNFHYGKYSYANILNLATFSTLQKCFFLQHYGVPTCLMDFTFDPLIAMYFAMSGIPGSSGSSFDCDGNCTHFSTTRNEDYVSIYRINYKILAGYFSIKEINAENFDPYLSAYKTAYNQYSTIDIHLGLVLEPEKDLKGDKINNLSVQKGCFLLFDNKNGLDIKNANVKVDFIRFLESHQSNIKLELPEPVMTIFRIKYNAFMWEKKRVIEEGKLSPSHMSAFEFLRGRGLTGQNLFNDIQGLKNDFNFIVSRGR